MRKRLCLAALLVVLGLTSCDYGEGSKQGRAGGVDATPEKLDGSSSNEFEADDINAANGASQAVQDYCAGAASEAQEVGCLSHVDEGDIP